MENIKIVICLFLGLFLFGCADNQVITNFDECAELYPVMESYPRQCSIPNGTRFTEEVICTMEYSPVCGVDGETYSNACVAERQNGVTIAYEGECGEDSKVYCTEEQKQAEICTMEYVPVCGSDGVTYGNKCSACSTGIDYYTSGEC